MDGILSNTASAQLITLAVEQQLEQLKDLLTHLTQHCQAQGESTTFQAIDRVIAHLAQLIVDQPDWREPIKQYCMQHITPIAAESTLGHLICAEQNNSSKGSYQLMEAIWHTHTHPSEQYSGHTQRGQLLNAYHSRCDNALANVHRIQWFAQQLSHYSHAAIAALGSGSGIEIREHLAQGDRGNQFYLFDHCKSACAQVSAFNQSHRQRPINVVHSNPLVGLLKSRRHYDLIYSLGLLDYVPVADSLPLVNKLLSRLKPGGRLILGNARPGTQSRFWLEMMGGWTLNYKNDQQMQAIGAGIAETQQYHLITDVLGVYNFLTIHQE